MTRTIAAPPGVVFHAVADVAHLPDIVPSVERIEFLSDTQSGVGTRFRETRRMGKHQSQTEIEITEYVPDERARMIADSHGTVWDTVFTVRPAGESSELELVMDARAHRFLPRILNPLMKGVIRAGVEKQVDAVVAYCERIAAAAD